MTTGEISQYMVNPPSSVLVYVMAGTGYFGHRIIDIAALKEFYPGLQGVNFSFSWSDTVNPLYGGWQSIPNNEFYYAGYPGYTFYIYKKNK